MPKTRAPRPEFAPLKASVHGLGMSVCEGRETRRPLERQTPKPSALNPTTIGFRHVRHAFCSPVLEWRESPTSQAPM